MMVPWGTNNPGLDTRPLIGPLVKPNQQPCVSGRKTLLSVEKYNLIKERLAAGTGPIASSQASVSSSSGDRQAKSSSSDEHQKMQDIVRPPPGHPFLTESSSRQNRMIHQNVNSSHNFVYHNGNTSNIFLQDDVIKSKYNTDQCIKIPNNPSPTKIPLQVSNHIKETVSFPSHAIPFDVSQRENHVSFNTLKTLTINDIKSLVLRLSASRIPVGAKKIALIQLLKTPNLSEQVVHQLLTMENGDLLTGLRCVLANYIEVETDETAEVLEMTLTFVNKCFSLKQTSTNLRSLILGKSKEMGLSNRGASVLEQLILVSRPRTNNATQAGREICDKISQELRALPGDHLLGVLHSSCNVQSEVSSWIKKELELEGHIPLQIVRYMEEKYRVVEASILNSDMSETSLSEDILSKYPSFFWPFTETIRQNGHTECVCLTVIRFLPSGHMLAYTNSAWRETLGRLEQELKMSLYSSQSSGLKDLKPGYMVMVGRSDIAEMSSLPLYDFCNARALVLSIGSNFDVRIFLLDHGINAVITLDKIASLPSNLKMSPLITLCRVQGIIPTPSTRLVLQSVTTLSHLVNSHNASYLVNRPSIEAPKILCQLLTSGQQELINPTLEIIHVLSSNPSSNKILVNSNKATSCAAMESIFPSLLLILDSHDSLSSATICTILETILSLLGQLAPDQRRHVFSSGQLVSSLTKIQLKQSIGQYQGVIDQIIGQNPFRQGSNSKPKSVPIPNMPEHAVFKNTDIRERQIYNPHRIVKTEKPVYASAQQLNNKDYREPVKWAAIEHPDLQRRRQEREELTADALKMFMKNKESLNTSNKEISSVTEDSKSQSDKSILSKPETVKSGMNGSGNTMSQESSSVHAEFSHKDEVKLIDSLKICEEEDAVNLPPRELKSFTDDDVSHETSSVKRDIRNPSTVVQLESDHKSGSSRSGGVRNSLPSWLGGCDESSSSDDEQDETDLPPWLSKPNGIAEASEVPSAEVSKSIRIPDFLTPVTSSSEDEQKITQDIDKPAICSPPTMPSLGENGSGSESCRDPINNDNYQENGKEQCTLTRDYIFSEKHSNNVELWDIERKGDFDKNDVAILVCGFLNSKDGGCIYAGVKKNGLIRGIPLERKDRDIVRQTLDRVLSNMISPRVPPNIVDIDFVPVEDRSRPNCPYRVIVVMVKGQKDGLNKLYMAHNLRTMSREGAYVRGTKGPVFNVKLEHQEMLSYMGKHGPSGNNCNDLA